MTPSSGAQRSRRWRRCENVSAIASALSIYLSSRSARRAELQSVARDCEAIGIEVVSTWIWASDSSHPDGAAAAARSVRDLADLARADLFAGFVEPPDAPELGRGGRHVELGAALALEIPVLLIGGHAEHVFHRHPAVARYPDWPAARGYLLTQVGETPARARRERR